ncbi:hypothetical protein HUZ36_16395 [Pseudoalteromonas sp. McH1-7]|uniref:Uncharacterized protein n=1 Tax=Pseudoalteromonas peptidolytica F12-50-A1 TaxID=1315280 RepID=A0A8I0N0F1_9GAMM|nr:MULTISPECIES: hypothetical protein [Pseudoalteromonas]MBE0348551.1 hypothetical protein [Pseudoalteromonas peptidolytica F12-50-A1]MDW7551431.1 hypothetical protein [Pseudoalteromonas peptidolytica]NLR17204.1 hypothetical protein [Pseudoalteromonas peptidolytica]NUZ12364.1 hypothetical protein [Pseudoalteromonas sp. McH1-7]USD30803.1 hypothetical protein J8Z24_17680 [Pseudoalteromonas sp. SCSIO 43201]
MKLTKEELLFINRTLTSHPTEQQRPSDNIPKQAQQTYAEIKKLLASISSHSQFCIVAKNDNEHVEFPLTNLSSLIDLLEHNVEAPSILEATQAGSARSWRTCPSTPVRLRVSSQYMPFNIVSISQSGGLLNTFPFKASAIQANLARRIAKLYLGDPIPLLAKINSIKVITPLELAISFTMDKVDNSRLKAFILHNYIQRKGFDKT